MDFVFDDVDASAVVSLQLRVTWDSAGNDPVLPGMTKVKLQGGRNADSSGNVKFTVVGVGQQYFFTAPSTQTTTGAVYIWIYPMEADTPSHDGDSDIRLRTCRIFWRDKT